MTTSIPQWISSLSTPVLQTDVATLTANGAQSLDYAGSVKLLTDFAATVAASASATVTSAEISDLQTISDHGGDAPLYVASTLMSELVFGDAGDLTWTGGASYSVSLGALQAGTTAAQLTELIDQRFLGADLPSLQPTDLASASYKAITLPLFASTGAPALADIREGNAGDGAFLAALLTLVQNNPQKITSMVASEANNIAAVSFYENGLQRWVTVNDELPVNQSGALIYNNGAVDWANLVEKAYAQFNINAYFGPQSSNSYANLSTVSIQNIYASLTGLSAVNTATFSSGDVAWNSYKTLFVNAINARDDLIVTESGATKNGAGLTLFSGDQDYAVIGYDSQTGDFILRNPMGDQGAGQTYVTQFEASMADLSTVSASIVIENTGSSTTVASAIQAHNSGSATPLIVTDTAANIFANLDLLQSYISAGTVSSLSVTDGTAPTETITFAQYVNDHGVLANLQGNYSLIVTGVGAASATTLMSEPTVAQISVSDSAAAVSANLDQLQSLKYEGDLTAISLTDAGTPLLSVSAAQLTSDAGALAEITGSYKLVATGVSVAEAASTLAIPHVVSIDISDSAATVVTNLDQMQSLLQKGQLAGITLTDGGTPTLSITAAQLTSDAAALSDISGTFTVTVAAGSSAVNLTGVAGHATTVEFTGAASQYSIATANGALTVTGGGVTDTLSNVAAIQFADLTEIVATSPGSGGVVTTGNVTELYAAVLDREPDLPGLVFYQTYLQKNPATPLQQFAEFFLSSPEYTAAHSYAESVAGDTQFITDSYQNLLHRTPSALEVSYYETNVLAPAVAGLTAGTTAYASAQLQSHALLLTYFSGSPEFLSDVQVTASNPPSAQHWLILV